MVFKRAEVENGSEQSTIHVPVQDEGTQRRDFCHDMHLRDTSAETVFDEEGNAETDQTE